MHEGPSSRCCIQSTVAACEHLPHRVHVDLVGPLPTGLRGNRYFLSIKDEATLLAFIYPIKSKNETHDKIKEFKSKYENLTEKRLKIVRADRSTEFISKAINSLNSEQGISMEHSAAYMPAQNGRAERTNRTIIESTRLIMKEMKLPDHLWPELVQAVAYTRNRSPGLDGMTPFKKGNDKKPDIRNLRAIGCRVWVKSTKPGQKKLDSRSWQGILVGYEGTNQY